MSELKDFKCPNCGGRLEFDAPSQKLKCPYCEGTFDPDLFEEPKEVVVDSETWNDDEMKVYTCNSCGGTLITDKDTVATSCPYCDNPIVLTSNVSGIYKPKKVIPFMLDKKQAKERYKQFLKGKPLLPNEFKDEATIDEIKGIYVPFWLFDGKASARMWFDAVNHRYWSDGRYNYVETSNYKLFRSGYVRFADVPVDASTKVSDQLTQSVEPYNSSASKPFSDNYLAGYLADKYDVDIPESREKANSRIANSTASIFRGTVVGYDNCIPSSTNIAISEGKQQYVMYPLWLLNVKYNGQIYTFAMNGQTGKFVGDLPTDNGKLIRIMLGVFFGVTAVLTLIQYLMYMMG